MSFETLCSWSLIANFIWLGSIFCAYYFEKDNPKIVRNDLKNYHKPTIVTIYTAMLATVIVLVLLVLALCFI